MNFSKSHRGTSQPAEGVSIVVHERRFFLRLASTGGRAGVLTQDARVTKLSRTHAIVVNRSLRERVGLQAQPFAFTV
jgi:hypothetical protein